MKRILFTLIIAFSYTCCCAQDSTKITYSEQKDTLTKQRFIDRYENVFMTKVPTRHMFKVGFEFLPSSSPKISPPQYQNMSLTVG